MSELPIKITGRSTDLTRVAIEAKRWMGSSNKYALSPLYV